MSSCLCTKLLKVSKEIKLTDILVRIIAFNPPKKCKNSIKSGRYEFKELPNNTKKSKLKNEFLFNYKENSTLQYPWITTRAFKIRKSNGKDIAVLYLLNKNKQGNFTVLFSHGNSCDLGSIYPILLDICSLMKIDVVAYDYSGYGLSTGKTSEKELYSDINEVVYFLKTEFKINSKHLILMGNSLGSVPTVELAIKNDYRNVGGVILISAIMSGIKLVTPDINLKQEDLEKYDFFNNISKIGEINCPILVIHGQKDEIIPYSQGVEICKKIKLLSKWFPSKGTHNNIFTKHRSKFYMKLQLFFDHLQIYNRKTVIEYDQINTKEAKLDEDYWDKYIDCKNNGFPFEKNTESKLEEVNFPIKTLDLSMYSSTDNLNFITVSPQKLARINSKRNLLTLYPCENSTNFELGDPNMNDKLENDYKMFMKMSEDCSK